MRLAAVIVLLAATAHAQVYLINHPRRGEWSGSAPSGIKVISALPRDDSRNPDLRDYLLANGRMPNDFPALSDLQSGCVVPITGTLAQARAALKDCRSQWRDSQREPDDDARFARQQWRQTGRSVMTALGQPVELGNNLTAVAMYSAITNLPAGNTRRDATLAALIADLAQTRAQLARQFPSTLWWWIEDTDE